MWDCVRLNIEVWDCVLVESVGNKNVKTHRKTCALPPPCLRAASLLEKIKKKKKWELNQFKTICQNLHFTSSLPLHCPTARKWNQNKWKWNWIETSSRPIGQCLKEGSELKSRWILKTSSQKLVRCASLGPKYWKKLKKNWENWRKIKKKKLISWGKTEKI